MVFYRPLFRLATWCIVVQLAASMPFTFPDGSSGEGGAGGKSRDRSSSSSSPGLAKSSRQAIFEGRSVRGNGPSAGSASRNHQYPDIYSRYQVHEDANDPPGVRPTAGSFLTNRPGVITPPPPLHTTRSDRPNAAYNRLPPSKNDEPIQAEPAGDEYEDEDEEDVGEEDLQPDKPVPVGATAAISRPPTIGQGSGGSNTVNNLFYNLNDKFGGLGALFGENSGRHKFKYKRRKPGQPCIPYSLFHKLKYGRDLEGNPVDPKTLLPGLNLVLADVNYYSPNNYGNGGGSHASDTGVGGGAVFNNHFYDAVGGYPCEGVTFGGGGGSILGGLPHKPFSPFKPHRPHGGPLGFFGQGGLFDWVSSADQVVQADEGVGTEGGGAAGGNRPTVVFNLNDAIDSVATNWRPGESFEMMMKVIANFITQVAGGAAAPVADVATDVRKINREFFSLFG